MREKLDKVGPGFCLAKWTQATLHLHSGLNHSCHHPRWHKIDFREIKENPSALHNTRYKKFQRKLMLEGHRPAECQYCWNVEDSPGDAVSDRIRKSSQNWSEPFFDQIARSSWTKDFTPQYLEVSLSSACNFKCSYCSPAVSSTWMKEIKEFGPYPTSHKFNNLEDLPSLPLPPDAPNPYIRAFWKWWPKLLHELKVLRITGGEPFLSPDLFLLLKKLRQKGNSNLRFAINTNLGYKRELLDQGITLLKPLQPEEKIKELVLFTSVEAWGKQAEYIRFGLNFDLFWSNVTRVLEQLPQTQLVIMSTYNVLSISTYGKFIDEFLKLKERFQHRLELDIPYLRVPEHQTVRVAPAVLKREVSATYQKMFKSGVFTEENLNSMVRIIDWIHQSPERTHLETMKKDFYRYFMEHDRRRGTNLLEIFPELKSLWEEGKALINRPTPKNLESLMKNSPESKRKPRSKQLT